MDQHPLQPPAEVLSEEQLPKPQLHISAWVSLGLFLISMVFLLLSSPEGLREAAASLPLKELLTSKSVYLAIFKHTCVIGLSAVGFATAITGTWHSTKWQALPICLILLNSIPFLWGIMSLMQYIPA